MSTWEHTQTNPACKKKEERPRLGFMRLFHRLLHVLPSLFKACVGTDPLTEQGFNYMLCSLLA